MNHLKDEFIRAWERIQQARYIVIVTHINPDADTLSSALALSNLFAEHNINHKVYNSSKSLPTNVNFLHRYDKITNQLPQSFDLAINVDCGSLSRFGFELDKKIDLINIDHHISNDNFGTINIVDAQKASTAELVYFLFKFNNLKISKYSAQCIYTGIYDDSLSFSTQRCDAQTFATVEDLITCGADTGWIAQQLRRRDSLAKYRVLPKVLNSLELFNEGKIAVIHLDPLWLKETGATPSDCEVALDMILNIAVVNIAIFLRQSKNHVRVSLRSKNGVDVSHIANHFNGGGHTMAAGCKIKYRFK
ncbi:MAG: bifunctional oligoribonuclease/PAP phosphatase NrnA [Campylobacterota bacterium]|nr:bifunctional oligoribonuclease/PAP phosphatase NrnA [Campylobacterota bacterium]